MFNFLSRLGLALLLGSAAIVVAGVILVGHADGSLVAAAHALATSTTGTSSTPIIAANNYGTGPALYGYAQGGTGVFGKTKFTAGTGATPAAGVMGLDIGTTGFPNDGIFGMTGSGGFGVHGESSDGAAGGVGGFASTGVGVEGSSNSGYGVYASSVSGTGAILSSSSGTGLRGSSSTGTAIAATSDRGLAVYSNATTGNGADLNGGYIGVVARAPANGGFPMLATDANGSDLFYVDGIGNVYYHGTLHTFSATAGGNTAIAYGSKTTAPTFEDTGTAQLVDGQATVRLDSAFAQSIDERVTYRVFLTPNADTRGLYVAQKGPAQFVVRETQGGRATLTFDYRIVAIALGHPTERMTIIRRSDAAVIQPQAYPLGVPARTIAPTRTRRRTK